MRTMRHGLGVLALSMVLPWSRGAITLVCMAAIIAFPHSGWSHGTPDQSQTAGFAGAGIFDVPKGQEFVPTASDVVGVDFMLTGVNPPYNDTVTVRLVEGACGGAGPILAQVSRVLTLAQGQDSIEHFDFPLPVTVTPGNIYMVEAQATNVSFAIHHDGLGDDYPAGVMCLNGSPFDADMYFVEYSSAPPTGTPTPTVTDAGLLAIGVVLLVLGLWPLRRVSSGG